MTQLSILRRKPLFLLGTLFLSTVVFTACGGDDGSSEGGGGSDGAGASGSGKGTGASTGGGGEGTGGNGSRDGAGGSGKGTGSSTGGGGEGTGSTGSGTGGGNPPLPYYEEFGSWLQSCDAGNTACEAAPWDLRLGEKFRKGPNTIISEKGPCGVDSFWGNYERSNDAMIFSRCDPAADASDPAGNSRTYGLSFEQEGERMILTSDGKTFTFERATRDTISEPTMSELSMSVLSTKINGCNYPTNDYIYRNPGKLGVFIERIGYSENNFYTDRIDDTAASNWVGSLGFIKREQRGLPMVDYLASTGTHLSYYGVLRDANLKPLSAVGFETDDCATETEDQVEAWEHDLVRDLSFRRFWKKYADGPSSNVRENWLKSDSTATITASGLSGTVQEVMVTVRTAANVDLNLTLTSPDGNQVVFHTGVPDGSPASGSASVRSGHEYTTFSDHASKLVKDEAVSTWYRVYKPEEALSAFVGDAKNGDWVLSITNSKVTSRLGYFGLSIR